MRAAQRTGKRYRNVKISGAEISGQTYEPEFGWTEFVGTACLMKVSAMIDAAPKMLRRVMALADGYGIPGFFPCGYDWSGIRDSSRTAHVKMEQLADDWATRTGYAWPWLPAGVGRRA